MSETETVFADTILKEPVAKEPEYWNDLPYEIPQLDIPDVGRNHIISYLYGLIK